MTASPLASARRPQRLRGPRPRHRVRSHRRTSAIRRGAVAAAGRPLRRRPPPLGLHARRAAGRARPARCWRARREAVARIDVVPRPTRRRRAASTRTSARSTSRPIVYLDDASRGAACAEALVLADRIGEELRVPVFLYGELPADGRPRTRARAAPRRRRAAWRAADRGAGELRARTSARRGCTRAPARRSSPRARRWSRSTSSSRPPATVEDARRDRRADPRGRRRGPARAARDRRRSSAATSRRSR